MVIWVIQPIFKLHSPKLSYAIHGYLSYAVHGYSSSTVHGYLRYATQHKIQNERSTNILLITMDLYTTLHTTGFCNTGQQSRHLAQ